MVFHKICEILRKIFTLLPTIVRLIYMVYFFDFTGNRNDGDM